MRAEFMKIARGPKLVGMTRTENAGAALVAGRPVGDSTGWRLEAAG